MSDPSPVKLATSDGGSLDVPRDGVYVANVNPGATGVHLTRSLLELQDYDREHRLGMYRGNLWAESGVNIAKHRNELVRQFLATDGDWLWFVDSDMVVPPATMLRLLGTAKLTGARMVGGLCVMVGPLGPIPTLYQFRTHDAITAVQYDYPDDANLEVAGTGAGCLMVHRSVLESYRAFQADNKRWLLERHKARDETLAELVARDMVLDPSEDYGWFQERVRIKRIELPDGSEIADEHWIGEDIEFCLRMRSLGFSVYVNTGAEVGHAKHGRIWQASDIRAGIGAPVTKVVAVIPAKDKLALTKSLVGQLREQGGADDIVVCDNGSGKVTRNWLSSQADLTVFTMPDAGIHDMWNAGIDHAMEVHGPRTQVAFLNNDLNLGPDFLKRLSTALRDHRDVQAVCGNYDGRTSTDTIQYTTDICANRYDGSGGFAGFAFMVRGEWFSSGYRFPTDCRWWYGDNDLIATIAWSDTHRGYDDKPSRAAIVLNAHVEHIGGGGNTAGDPAWTDPKWDQMRADDRAAFEAKWSKIHADAHAAERIRAGDLEPLYEHLLTQDTDIKAHLPRFVDLVHRLDAKTVIELGVRTGVSSIAWITALSKTDGHLWSVDIDPAPPIVATHPRCTFTQGADLDPFLLAQLPEQADIVFVDTDHTYELTVEELGAYRPKVRDGGCIVLHDVAVETFEHHTTPQPPFPVRQAVEEFATANDLKVDWYDDSHGLAVVWMPDMTEEPATHHRILGAPK